MRIASRADSGTFSSILNKTSTFLKSLNSLPFCLFKTALIFSATRSASSSIPVKTPPAASAACSRAWLIASIVFVVVLPVAFSSI